MQKDLFRQHRPDLDLPVFRLNAGSWATVDFGQLIFTRPDLGRESCAPPADQMEPKWRALRCSAALPVWPAGFRDAIAMRSHILPSYGHSLDKTAGGVGGWSTRRIVDHHHRMTLDGKGRRQ